jgi:hypothetical protein
MSKPPLKGKPLSIDNLKPQDFVPVPLEDFEDLVMRTSPEDFVSLAEQMRKAKRVSVEHDPEFDGIREGLLAALRDFADRHPLPDGPMSFEGIVELYEKGFLRIESDGDFWRIGMCDPTKRHSLKTRRQRSDNGESKCLKWSTTA